MPSPPSLAEQALVAKSANSGTGWKLAIKNISLHQKKHKKSNRKSTPIITVVEDLKVKDAFCESFCRDGQRLLSIPEARAVHQTCRSPSHPETLVRDMVMEKGDLERRILDDVRQSARKQSFDSSYSMSVESGNDDMQHFSLHLPIHDPAKPSPIFNMSWEAGSAGCRDSDLPEVLPEVLSIGQSSVDSRSALVSPISFAMARTGQNSGSAVVSPILSGTEASNVFDRHQTDSLVTTDIATILSCPATTEYSGIGRPEAGNHSNFEVSDSEEKIVADAELPNSSYPQSQSSSTEKHMSLPPPYEGSYELAGSHEFQTMVSKVMKQPCTSCQRSFQDDDFYDYCPKCPHEQSLICMSCARVGGCPRHRTTPADKSGLDSNHACNPVFTLDGEIPDPSRQPGVAKASEFPAMQHDLHTNMHEGIYHMMEGGRSMAQLGVVKQHSHHSNSLKPSVSVPTSPLAILSADCVSLKRQGKLKELGWPSQDSPQACTQDVSAGDLLSLLRNVQLDMQAQKTAMALKEQELSLRAREMMTHQLIVSVVSGLERPFIGLPKDLQLTPSTEPLVDVLRDHNNKHQEVSAGVTAYSAYNNLSTAQASSPQSCSQLRGTSFTTNGARDVDEPFPKLSTLTGNPDTESLALEAAERTDVQAASLPVEVSLATDAVDLTLADIPIEGCHIRERPSQKRKQTQTQTPVTPISGEAMPRTPTKQTIQNVEQQNNGPDDDDDEDDSLPPKRHRSQRLESEPSPRFLACPYAKHDPSRYSARNPSREEKKYRNCSHSLVENISRLKQHLVRTHRQPKHHCRRCFEVFQSLRESDEHQAQMISCLPADCPFSEKMDNDQQELIHKKRPMAPPLEQWYDIYKILFPGAPLPESPFVEYPEPPSPMRMGPSTDIPNQAVNVVSQIFNAGLTQQGESGALSVEQCDLVRQEFLKAMRMAKLSLTPLTTHTNEHIDSSPSLRSPLSAMSSSQHSHDDEPVTYQSFPEMLSTGEEPRHQTKSETGQAKLMEYQTRSDQPDHTTFDRYQLDSKPTQPVLPVESTRQNSNAIRRKPVPPSSLPVQQSKISLPNSNDGRGNSNVTAFNNGLGIRGDRNQIRQQMYGASHKNLPMLEETRQHVSVQHQEVLQFSEVHPINNTYPHHIARPNSSTWYTNHDEPDNQQVVYNWPDGRSIRPASLIIQVDDESGVPFSAAWPIHESYCSLKDLEMNQTDSGQTQTSHRASQRTIDSGYGSNHSNNRHLQNIVFGAGDGSVKFPGLGTSSTDQEMRRQYELLVAEHPEFSEQIDSNPR